MKKLSWKSVHKLDYQEKKLLGNKMRLSMRHPKQWKVCIQENLHWYVCLEHIPTNGLLTVWPDCGRYSTLLSLDMPHVGDPELSDEKSFSTPQSAIDHTVAKAKRIMQAKMKILDKICKYLN